MKVKIKKLNDKAIIPKYATQGDAGLDLVAIEENHEEDYIEYSTGLAIEIPEGYMGLIFPRSSNSKQDLLLCNSVGVIDSSYRGEILVRYKRIVNPIHHADIKDLAVVTAHCFQKHYKVGDRVAQLIILPYPQIEFEEVKDLSETERGSGGFGSTNK